MLYSSVIQSKNGNEIPLFLDGKPMHSKYNPSAEKLLTDSSIHEGFFLIGGIGGGYHIASLVHQLTNYCIIAFEADKESLDFCMKLKNVQALADNPRIIFCLEEEVPALLRQKYIAALYGNFSCFFQRAWQQKNEATCKRIEEDLKTTLQEISADFSVQAHFGKIWMHNILVNLQNYSSDVPVSLDRQKLDRCAAIIAAGPTLDNTIKILEKQRNDFFIIATDTASGPLYRRGIIPDAIVCVDAQQVSTEHFYPLPAAKEGNKSPLVFLDLCTAPSSVRMLKERGIEPHFFHSGHPLSILANEECGMMQVETGSGTVTIAAADIARQLGFRRIRFFAADFAYSAGKPYAKGSYLDNRFNSWSNRLFSAEQQFSGLMYRTPLRKKETGIFTNDVLESYEKSLKDWQEKYGYTKKLDELYCENAEKRRGIFNLPFNFKAFMENNLCDLGQIDDSSALYHSKAFYALLPYVAYLRKHADIVGDGKTKDSRDLLKLAYNYARSFAN